MKRLTQQEAQQYRKLDPDIDFKYNMKSAIAFTLESDPLYPGYETVTYYGPSWVDPTNIPQHPHYVYVLVNPSIPGVCKIGYTTTTVYDRVRQINMAVGVIMPWYPVFVYKCPNGAMLEREVHDELERLGARINPKREGFYMSSDTARNIIERLGKKYETSGLSD
jgi:hypothetical protein